MKTNQDIFLHLLQEHRGILLKISRIYMSNVEDQQDLQQEIIFQLWRSFDRFEGKSKFSTWMYRVAINTAITYLKNEKRRIDRDELTQHIARSVEEDSDQKESRLAYFYKAVHELNKIEKALILLFIEGLSHKEIAENLGLTEVNTRVKLNRIKKQIQQHIKNQGYEF